MTVKWYGKDVLRDIERDMGQLEEETAKRIEAKAKRLCPVDTGALRDSIKAQKSKYKDGGWIVSEGNENVKYGHFIELGVPSRNVPKTRFMRRAGLGERNSFIRRAKRLLDK